MENNNLVKLAGTIASDFEFSHDMFGEKFFNVLVDVERTSGYVDRIVVKVSERLVDLTEDWTGEKVIINGQFRSYNKHDGEKNHLMLFVFATAWEFAEKLCDESDIWLDGFICKKPIYRTTPLGREITDVLLAVNRPYGKSDYIPCIVWGRNAKFVDTLPVGTHVKVAGRIQSRTYVKLIDGIEEAKTAYEVSIAKLEVVND
jgi:single-stranded DNA-binding protein